MSNKRKFSRNDSVEIMLNKLEVTIAREVLPYDQSLGINYTKNFISLNCLIYTLYV